MVSLGRLSMKKWKVSMGCWELLMKYRDVLVRGAVWCQSTGILDNCSVWTVVKRLPIRNDLICMWVWMVGLVVLGSFAERDVDVLMRYCCTLSSYADKCNIKKFINGE